MEAVAKAQSVECAHGPPRHDPGGERGKSSPFIGEGMASNGSVGPMPDTFTFTGAPGYFRVISSQQSGSLVMLQGFLPAPVPIRHAREAPKSAPSAGLPPRPCGRRGARERPVGCAFPPKAHPGRRGALATSVPGNGPRVSPLPEGGGGVGFLLGIDEQRYGFDQGQVGERLREVAHVLAGAGVDLLGVELQGSGEGE